ncbi:MAG: hypothetical protein MHPSP_000181, partial [Paramarteilia canceri]
VQITTDCGTNILMGVEKFENIECVANRLNTVFTNGWSETIAYNSEVNELDNSVNALISNIQHKAGIQKMLPVKIKTGSQTRAWRGLEDHFNKIMKNYKALASMDSFKKLVYRIDLDVLKNIHELIKMPMRMFDKFEKSDETSINAAVLVFFLIQKIILYK